jgi:hypothetical protein
LAMQPSIHRFSIVFPLGTGDLVPTPCRAGHWPSHSVPSSATIVGYPVICYITNENGPIEIVDLSWFTHEKSDFRKMLVYQRVNRLSGLQYPLVN